MDHLLKKKERIQNFKKKGDINYICKNELDKVCFQHEMAYGYFKDLARRTASDKTLRDKAFNITRNPRYDGYQRGLASVVYKVLIKSLQVAVLICLQIMSVLWNYLKNNTNQLLENFKKEEFI